MNSRGATWRASNRDKHRKKRKGNLPEPNRRRKTDDAVGADLDLGLVDMSYDELQYHVRQCRKKKAHPSYGGAYKAKQVSEERNPGVVFEIYRCPICGKFHLTTHPWKNK